MTTVNWSYGWQTEDNHLFKKTVNRYKFGTVLMIKMKIK